MNYEFKSNFKDYIEGFIKQKNALGFPYLNSQRILFDFDKFCVIRFSAERELTKEIGLSWAVIKDTEKSNSFMNRLAPIRELAKYMNRLEVNAYIIPGELVRKNSEHYVPHIFTNSELKMFFAATDSLPFNKRCPFRHLIASVLFRLTYCCGLRPNESRLLKTGNINLETGEINIIESKGHKDRIVMLSDDVLRLCKKYYQITSGSNLKNEYFFQSKRGSAYSGNELGKIFHLCWRNSAITSYSGNMPRIYDLRHTFVTNRMYLWLKEGKDLNAYLPYLSAYLGHSKFSHTAYYIHLVPEFFPQMSKMDLSKYANLLPEVNYEDM